MFNDFTFSNPTTIHFGKKSLENLNIELKKYKKILLVHEGEITKQIGVYDKVVKQLIASNVEFIDFPEVTPNPKNTICDKGARIAQENNVDLILAVGGGSSIDASKAIALCSTNKGDNIYDYIDNIKQPINDPLPIGVVLTSAATSSENSPALVISNEADGRKSSYFSQKIFPKFAICNPEFTFTLPKFQTASGAFDILSHVVEQYLALERFDASEIPSINQLQALVKWVPIALANPSDYEARANIMWCSTLALNGHGYIGKNPGWYAHGLSYPITSKYRVPHGASIALIMPHLFEYQLEFGNNKKEFENRLKEISKIIFNHTDVNQFIVDFKKMINDWGLYTSISGYDIQEPSDEELKELSKIGFLGHSNDSFLDTKENIAYEVYKKVLQNKER